MEDFFTALKVAAFLTLAFGKRFFPAGLLRFKANFLISMRSTCLGHADRLFVFQARVSSQVTAPPEKQREERPTKRETLQDVKTLQFAAHLNSSYSEAVDYLELLESLTSKMAIGDNIDRLSDEAIARACGWMGEPQKFIKALVKVDFISRAK